MLFRVLITKESPDEKVILRDIHRTFPAHEFFKEAGGVGQESLYRISKVFNLYEIALFCSIIALSKNPLSTLKKNTQHFDEFFYPFEFGWIKK